MPSAQRVAYQYLVRRVEAGLLEAPPAMLANINEWILATVAATHVASHESAIQRQQTVGRREVQDRMRPIQAALAALEAAPTSWEAYKTAYDTLWVFGHPGTRWNVRDFQKMTPERRTELEQRVHGLVEHARERVQDELARPDQAIAHLGEENTRLRPYLRSGVPGISGTGEALKQFPVDLKGWRYGEELDRRVEERIKTNWAEFGEGKELTPELRDLVQRTVENTLRKYKVITVKLSADAGVKNAVAFWREMDRLLWVRLPYGARPYELDHLGTSLRHELQHFAQTYLGYALMGIDDAGLTEMMQKQRTPRPGMPSRHVMTPEYTQHQESPEAKALQQKLRTQGIDPRGVDFHALDDIEFYTRLSDSIDRFKAAVQFGKPTRGQLNTVIKLWVGELPYPDLMGGRFRHTEDWHDAMEALGGYELVKHFETDRFFLNLKRMARGKYQKAVSEFVKAVT